MATKRWIVGALVFVAAVATAASAAAQMARIAAKDKLTIKVVSGVDLGASEFTVDLDGAIDFPYLGRVKVSGMTPRELGDQLAALLIKAQVLSGQPQLTVDLEQTPGKTVSVSGAVVTPGEYAYAGEMSVYAALLKAGGATTIAGDEIQVIRAPQGDQPTEILTLSRRQVERGDFATNVTLRDRDRVVVLEARQVFIGGYVGRPAAYTVPPETTLRQALLLAGDVTELGARNRIEILRDGKKLPDEEVDLDKTIIQPGDTINVPKRRM
jgi:polysaccharide export outer membrane protein